MLFFNLNREAVLGPLLDSSNAGTTEARSGRDSWFNEPHLLNPNSLTPGKMNIPLSTTPGMGRDQTTAANAASDSNSISGNGAGHAESGGGGTGFAKNGGAGGAASVGNGSSNTSGEGAGGNGTGKGGRGANGKGAGAGSGRGTGTGSGGGSGSGSESFPGITIQGGEDAEASNANPPKFTIEQQAPYAMTVVSTANSGGGLEDFGVFHDERIFTVYIPMKRNENEDDPTWALQYALQDDSVDTGTGQVLVPMPFTRVWPDFPAGLLDKYTQRQVVLSALIDKDGKVSGVTVKRTPGSASERCHCASLQQMGLPPGTTEQPASRSEDPHRNTAINDGANALGG